MSYALDVNILLYASDEANSVCGQAREFVRECVESPDAFFLAWPTVMSYLRIATHPGIFENPLSTPEAIGNVETLMKCPHLRILNEGPGFWQAYKETTGDVPTRGNLVPDAHLATILRQHGVDIIYTRDRDFHKFTWLEVIDPFA